MEPAVNAIETVTLSNVEVQANGIIRNSKGRLIARLVDDIDFEGEHIKQLKTEKKTVEQAILDKILYIGDEIPKGVAEDKRSKFVVLGTPQELIDETSK